MFRAKADVSMYENWDGVEMEGRQRGEGLRRRDMTSGALVVEARRIPCSRDEARGRCEG